MAGILIFRMKQYCSYACCLCLYVIYTSVHAFLYTTSIYTRMYSICTTQSCVIGTIGISIFYCVSLYSRDIVSWERPKHASSP